jgi:hypothetical protein
MQVDKLIFTRRSGMQMAYIGYIYAEYVQKNLKSLQLLLLWQFRLNTANFLYFK